MTEALDYNATMIADFRATNGQMSSGAPIVLLHHQGRRSGKDFIAPLVYQRDPHDQSAVYIFASKAGAPTDPEWYHNIVAAGHATVEIGAERYDAGVTELTGAARDEVYDRQASAMPNFAEYAEKTAGIRTIPVIKLSKTD
jgi:deazaflavin-dependent oxidoreductase (nitroreductase family)